MNHWLFVVLSSSVLLSPVLLLAVMGLASFRSRSERQERDLSLATYLSVMVGLLSSIAILGLMLLSGQREIILDLGDWIVVQDESFHFHLQFIFDRLSIPYLILTFALCGVVGAFASRYMHREPGFHRFFVMYSLFLLGMVVSALAGTIEVLFLGWELVGLSSALLVGFFHERTAPVQNGFRVWTVYRLADAAFLLAAVAFHHMTGEGDFHHVMSNAAWPDTQSTLTGNQALVVGLLLLVAAAGKSALIPFSGWLPRAMEGPTASSAIFYGALSVHLGAYLLLRISPVIAASPTLGWIIVGVGLSTALYASLVERVQADIKSALAYASLTQVGLIVAETGMGWHYLALVHLMGHAMMRTLQLLRAPGLLQDYFKLQTALGHRVASGQTSIAFLDRAPVFQRWLYRFALHRGYFDALLENYFVTPLIRLARTCSRWESAWIQWWERKP